MSSTRDVRQAEWAFGIDPVEHLKALLDAQERRFNDALAYRDNQIATAHLAAEKALVLVAQEDERRSMEIAVLKDMVSTLQGRALAFAGFGAILSSVATALIVRAL